MKPDRVIGLRGLRHMAYNSSQCPLIRKKIFLPFLVIEAKKEANAPGFQAIQQQTAFPIRRLLKAQKELLGNDQNSASCLVWFFAYQGELWRLYICTFEKTKVVRSPL